eukprot:1374415-Pyramimonas_sp.AAC.1
MAPQGRPGLLRAVLRARTHQGGNGTRGSQDSDGRPHDNGDYRNVSGSQRLFCIRAFDALRC